MLSANGLTLAMVSVTPMVTSDFAAAGWTPCIGPILGGIIGLASVSASGGQGPVLLLVYAIGLGIPFVLVALGATAVPAAAQVSVGIALPGVSIGINVPAYPRFVRVPGYPVYYAPGLSANFFFYDGMYWVLQDDRWYASSWYNGPWSLVDPYAVPLYILRIPVRYYRRPPAYFHGWHRDAAPRWGEHWGRDWSERYRDWVDRKRKPIQVEILRPDLK